MPISYWHQIIIMKKILLSDLYYINSLNNGNDYYINKNNNEIIEIDPIKSKENISIIQAVPIDVKCNEIEIIQDYIFDNYQLLENTAHASNFSHVKSIRRFKTWLRNYDLLDSYLAYAYTYRIKEVRKWAEKNKIDYFDDIAVL